jgi:hypothetical protein
MAMQQQKVLLLRMALLLLVVRTKWQRRSRTPPRRSWKGWQAQVGV